TDRCSLCSGSSCQQALAFVAVVAGMLLATTAGCNRQSPGIPSASAGPTPAEKPTVTAVRPTKKTLQYTIRQPAYNIEAFEQTPIFAKIAGYIEKVNVDIGDIVHKGDLLALLFVPELQVELKQYEELVRQAAAEVVQAKETALAAEASFRSAEAKVKEAEASE